MQDWIKLLLKLFHYNWRKWLIKMTDEMGGMSHLFLFVNTCMFLVRTLCMLLGRQPTVCSIAKKSYSTTTDWFQSVLSVRLRCCWESSEKTDLCFMCNINDRKWTQVICLNVLCYEGIWASVSIKYIFVPSKKQQMFIKRTL